MVAYYFEIAQQYKPQNATNLCCNQTTCKMLLARSQNVLRAERITTKCRILG